MKEKANKETPYKPLGEMLRRMREKHQQTLAEVSGAVEIDVTMLTDIECGSRRPAEDILRLLISHFALKEDEADKLLELAGYTKEAHQAHAHNEEVIQPVLVIPMDSRIVYADMFTVATSEYGVVLSFLQGSGPGGKALPVGRIGMSREHAENVLDQLYKALHQEQKLLPAPESSAETPETS